MTTARVQPYVLPAANNLVVHGRLKNITNLSKRLVKLLPAFARKSSG